MHAIGVNLSNFRSWIHSTNAFCIDKAIYLSLTNMLGEDKVLRFRECSLQVCVEFLQNSMSGFNVLVLQGQDKQAGKEAIVTRTRANKTEKVSPLHIIHVKSVLTLVHVC